MNSTTHKDAIKSDSYEMSDDGKIKMPLEMKKQGKDHVKYTRGIRNYKAIMANIHTNKKAAIKYIPEVHRKMSPIFIKCEINGEIVTALVDTGADFNFMTVSCAKRCYVTSLINTELCHDIVGVSGRMKSLGDIHFYPITIENTTITASFRIMKSNQTDMIFGMKTLKEYQCAIDMKTRTLTFEKVNVKTLLLEDDHDNPPPQEEEFYVISYEQLSESKQHEMDLYLEAAYNAGHFKMFSFVHITCLVNGHPVKALVDSGAQGTFLSRTCAERCDILKLTDTKCSETCEDVVGTTQTFGRVHFCPIQIEGNILYSPVDIGDLEVDMLLGIDILERYHCTLNLKQSTLFIGRTATEVNSAKVVSSTR